MPSEISIKDAEKIADLELDLFPDNCFNSKTLENEIREGVGAVIYEDGQLVGYYFGREKDGLTDILRIGVRREYQGLGYGTELLRLALEKGSRYMLTVQKDNSRAIRLYRKHGFEITAQTDHSWVMITC